jgi:hypothetical protein
MNIASLAAWLALGLAVGSLPWLAELIVQFMG